jgi:hypothetical protein
MDEYEVRQSLYIKNYLMTRHQAGSSLMKLNHMADWSDEEYDSILGLKHVSSSSDDSNINIPDPVEDNYVPIDWRALGAVTSVKDRSKWISPTTGNKEYCAGSYAVATAEVLEGY